jgi:MYXO-CTERM domain-containing protein
VQIAIAPSDPLVVYAFALFGEIDRSTDGGRSWTQVTRGDGITDLAVDATAPATVYVTQNGDLIRSTDGGEHWTTVHSPPGTAGYNNVVVDPERGTVFALSDRTLLSSEDRGTTWTEVAAFDLNDPRIFALATTHPTSLYVLADEGLLISRDRGRTWAAVELPVEPTEVAALAVDPRAARTVYIAAATYAAATESGAYTLLRSDDSGRSWRRLDGQILSTVNDLAVDPNDRSVVYAATCGNGVVALRQPVPAEEATGGGCALTPSPEPSGAIALMAALALAGAAARRRRRGAARPTERLA